MKEIMATKNQAERREFMVFIVRAFIDLCAGRSDWGRHTAALELEA